MNHLVVSVEVGDVKLISFLGFPVYQRVGNIESYFKLYYRQCGRYKVNEEGMIDELVEQLEGVANFMRGMQFDRQIPQDVREALKNRAEELDKITCQYE